MVIKVAKCYYSSAFIASRDSHSTAQFQVTQALLGRMAQRTFCMGAQGNFPSILWVKFLGFILSWILVLLQVEWKCLKMKWDRGVKEDDVKC